MDIFLIILGSICLLVGLAGCIVPMLPGPPVSYLALVFLHFTDKVSFTIPQLFFWLFIVVLIQILDYFIPMFGVKRLGGTPWGKWVASSVPLPAFFCSPPGTYLSARLWAQL